MTHLYMLDTNMVSYITRGHSLAARKRMLKAGKDEAICISTITEAEIRYGLAKRPNATALSSLMEAFMASVQILPWGRDEAEAYGTLRARLEAIGKPLDNMDMMIAAHAIATDATLVTNDNAFAQAKEIRATVNWATDI